MDNMQILNVLWEMIFISPPELKQNLFGRGNYRLNIRSNSKTMQLFLC